VSNSADIPSPASAGEAHPPVHNDTHLDFLTATSEDSSLFLDLLDPGARDRPPRRRYGSAQVDAYGVEVSTNFSGTGRARLRMDGTALARWRRRHGSEKELFLHLHENKVSFTRLDLSRDHSGPVTPVFIRDAFRTGRVSSTFRRPPRVETEEGGGGSTVRFGRSRQNTELNFYDKKAELASDGHAVEVERLTRVEHRLRRDAAARIAPVIAASGEYTDPGTGESTWNLTRAHTQVLAEQLHFRVATSSLNAAKENKNQSRIPDDPVWAAFIGDFTPVVVTTALHPLAPQEEAALYLANVGKSMLPALALLAEVLTPEELHLVARGGRNRIKQVFLDLHRDHPGLIREMVRDQFKVGRRRRPALV